MHAPFLVWVYQGIGKAVKEKVLLFHHNLPGGNRHGAILLVYA